MSLKLLSFPKGYPVLALIVMGVVVLAAVLALVSCGTNMSTNMSSVGTGMGSATVSISDPPSCAAPTGDFSHVWITIRSVQAHISATADESSPGWQELAPQLVAQPVQVDLLNLPANGACLLAILGSTSSLPAGDFQQIRVLLLANAVPSGPAPAKNHCASLGQVFNCVVDKNGFSTLELSSEAQTGLKIPPGQIVGGPIHVAAGQSVDINIDFNACASILREGNGTFRLKPALTAGVISPNTTGISGQVVDSVSGQGVAGAQVALEQIPTGDTVDRIIMQATTDANGRFNFCPLPTGAVFDVVVDAIVTSSGVAVAYDATIVANVPGGTALGAIQLVKETGQASGPGIIQGFVTAVNGTTGASIDATMSAFQTASISGGTRTFTVPLEKTTSLSSTPTIMVQSSSSCPMGSPMGAFCAEYVLVVPASNPDVGVFSAGKVTFTAPASGDVLYTVEAKATKPMTGNTPICTPSTQTTNQDASSMPLKVTAGATVNAKRIDFSSCS